MNKEILYEILNSESESLSSAEIEGILNEELDKSPEEMDTDLIDLCLDALNTVDDEKLNKRKFKVRISRILIAAVIFVLLIGISIPVCAKFFSVDVPDGIVSFYNDCFKIDISNDEYIDDILGQLEQEGLENVVLPKIVFSLETTVSNYVIEDSNNSKYIDFDFKNDNIAGHVEIQQYNTDYNFVIGNKKINSDYENIEYFDVNDISVLVFYNNGVSYINYLIDNIEYNIFIYCDYETACQIAKTL
ncbi:MAG: hypothetical protein ACI4RR_01010 [Eubacterium sp.]